PQVNQVEVNPLNQQIFAQENMIKNNVQIEACAPFGEGRNNMFDNEVLKDIGAKYGKSVAQVILRWLIQRGVVALAKSTHVERMEENFNIFDFKLSEEDMETIKNLDTGKSLFFNHQEASTVDLFVKFVEQRRNKN
ncbi:MAG: aldo/keto reductase, partial [Sarcina ventriculi]|nr:aldo/keto reductase [Sarcina ventriculi]